MIAVSELVGQGSAAKVYALEPGRVVKVYGEGVTLLRAEREFAAAQAAFAAGLPTPRVHDLLTVDGKPALIFDRVQGETLLEQLMAKSVDYHALSAEFAGLHDAIFRTKGTGLASQADVLEGYLQSSVAPAEATAGMGRFLLDLRDDTWLCHGDFQPENVMMTANGPVVIDWFNGTCGTPAGDVAWTLMKLQHAGLPKRFRGTDLARQREARLYFIEAYLDRLGSILPIKASDIQAWLRVSAAARLGQPVHAAEKVALLLRLSVPKFQPL